MSAVFFIIPGLRREAGRDSTGRETMKKLLLVLSATLFSAPGLFAAPQLVTVTQAGGPKTFQPTDIIQVVGVVGNIGTSGNASSPALRVTFQDGTVVENLMSTHVASTSQTNNFLSASNPLLGNSFVGITSLEIINQPGAVTVKVLKQAEELVSEPMILPLVEDSDRFTISLETSVDMQNWAPAAPGDYLGGSSHRFFRVKAVKKEAATAAPEQ